MKFKEGFSPVKKAFRAGGKVIKKTGKKGANAVKSKAKKALEESNDRKQPTDEYSRDVELTGGEFVVNSESRLCFAYSANIVLWILIILGTGELIFAFIAYRYLNEFSELFGESYSTSTLPFVMGMTCFLICTVCIFGFWIVWKYRDYEEDGNVMNIRKSNVWLKISFMVSIILSVLLIYLMLKCSSNLYELDSHIGSIILDNMKTYTIHRDNKAEIDRIQWLFSCCGSKSYTDWFQISLIGRVTKDNPNWKWYIKRFKNPISEDILKNTSFVREDIWYGNDVPFSCCASGDPNPCRFYDVDNRLRSYNKNQTVLTGINTNGCEKEMIERLESLKTGIHWYRLTELALLFSYIIMIEIIERSIQSQYDSNNDPPTVKFPVLLIIFMGLTLVLLYFFLFTKYSPQQSFH